MDRGRGILQFAVTAAGMVVFVVVALVLPGVASLFDLVWKVLVLLLLLEISRKLGEGKGR